MQIATGIQFNWRGFWLVFYLAEALATKLKGRELYQKIGERYVVCWSDMSGRAPGGTCGGGVHRLGPNGEGWDTRQFAAYGGG